MRVIGESSKEVLAPKSDIFEPQCDMGKHVFLETRLGERLIDSSKPSTSVYIYVRHRLNSFILKLSVTHILPTYKVVGEPGR